MKPNTYSCMYCNKFWNVDDRGFVYWRTNSAGENLDGREGRAKSSLGWFAHCKDKEACALRKKNNHAGLPAGQMEMSLGEELGNG